MRTITLPEFQALIERSDWKREQEREDIDTIDVDREEWGLGNDYPEMRTVKNCFGFAKKTSTLEDIEISYTESYNFDLYEADTFAAGTEGMDDVWYIGVIVLDDDGDEINTYDLVYYLSSEFSDIDYSDMEIDKTIDIDISENETMENYIVTCDNEPNLRFKGEKIAFASSRTPFKDDRWTELTLYKTAGGKYICSEVGRTCCQGERTRYKGEVCDSIDEVISFFGHGWLAKELYDDAKIDTATVID